MVGKRPIKNFRPADHLNAKLENFQTPIPCFHLVGTSKQIETAIQ